MDRQDDICCVYIEFKGVMGTKEICNKSSNNNHKIDEKSINKTNESKNVNCLTKYTQKVTA